MTLTGTQLGTPVYMSPEQVRADKSIDHRSDIYSLGVTMFYGIYGKPPYNTNTDSYFDIFNKIVYEPLPNLSASSKYYDIVLKACQKNRNERFQSCSEMLHKLKLENLNPFIDEDKTLMNQLTNDNVSFHLNSSNAIAGDLNPDTNSKKRRNLIFYVVGVISIFALIFFIIESINNEVDSISIFENEKDRIVQAAKKYEYGDFIFVNKTTQTIKLAICYPDTTGDWKSYGWFEILPGQSYDYHCLSVRPELYYYAYSDDNEFIGSSHVYEFSVNKNLNKFEIHQSLGEISKDKVTFMQISPNQFDRIDWPFTINFTPKKESPIKEKKPRLKENESKEKKIKATPTPYPKKLKKAQFEEF